MDKSISDFQRNCFSNYLTDIQNKVKEFPKKYLFPDGNPIQPVLPVCVVKSSIMVIGAFPSARFERRNGFLIPVANNLSPFAEEIYFDGREVRKQASREALDKFYFPQLGIDPAKIWLTDLVKVYLYPQKHIKNCKEINKSYKFVDTHKLFLKIAETSIPWMQKEILLCNPKLIITLGEVSARVLRNDKKLKSRELLNGTVNKINIKNKEYLVASLAHPEIRRIDEDWNKFTEKAILKLNEDIEKIVSK